MTRWRITCREPFHWADKDAPPPRVYEIAGDTLHVTPSGDMFILGPNPRLEVIHAWSAGTWQMAEKLPEPRVPVLERLQAEDHCSCIRMSDCAGIAQIDPKCKVHGVA